MRVGRLSLAGCYVLLVRFTTGFMSQGHFHLIGRIDDNVLAFHSTKS